MKILFTSDIHQNSQKWGLLGDACEDDSFDIVVIAGDLFPHDRGVLNEKEYLPYIKDNAKRIKDSGAELVLTMGNDDNNLLIKDMEEGDSEGLWHYVQEKVEIIKGYEFCGMSWVTDYPFLYKYWVRGDTKLNSGQEQYSGSRKPIFVGENNEWEDIDGGIYKLITDNPSLEEILDDMVLQVKDMSKSIWLIHQPPSAWGMDQISSGAFVGSQAVLRFIFKNSPLITVHGHIHEAPEVNGGIWYKQLDNTTIIQAGQLGNTLNYVTLELNDKTVTNIEHSKYK